MLSYNELKPGILIEYEGSVCKILEANFLRMQQRKPVMKTKIQDIITGKVRETSFQQSDQLEEADVERMRTRFIYESKGQYWFDEIGNPRNRFFFTRDQLGDKVNFLKTEIEIVTLMWRKKIIGIQLPIKIDLKVTEAPPPIKGDTASGGSKQVTLETGMRISAPFFVGEGDVVRINTESGEYVERMEKA